MKPMEETAAVLPAAKSLLCNGQGFSSRESSGSTLLCRDQRAARARCRREKQRAYTRVFTTVGFCSRFFLLFGAHRSPAALKVCDGRIISQAEGPILWSGGNGLLAPVAVQPRQGVWVCLCLNTEGKNLPSKYQSPQDNARLLHSVLPTGGRVLSGVLVLAWTLLWCL